MSFLQNFPDVFRYVLGLQETSPWAWITDTIPGLALTEVAEGLGVTDERVEAASLPEQDTQRAF